MSTSKTLFLEQQETAFYAQKFDALTAEELNKIVSPFLPARSELPSPLTIFTKRFPFMPASLKVMRQRQLAGDPKALVPTQRKSRLGVTLVHRPNSEDFPAAATSSGNNKIADSANAKMIPASDEEDLIGQIEGLEAKDTAELCIRCDWVEELLQQDDSPSKKPASPVRLSSDVAKSPVLLSESDFGRISTPDRERYYRNKANPRHDLGE